MSNVSFEIKFRKWYDPKTYRAQVEITLHSDNVIRFTIKAGDKEMYMEKLIFRKTHQWKIKGANFRIDGPNTKENATLIVNIQDAIDLELGKLGYN